MGSCKTKSLSILLAPSMIQCLKIVTPPSPSLVNNRGIGIAKMFPDLSQLSSAFLLDHSLDRILQGFYLL